MANIIKIYGGIGVTFDDITGELVENTRENLSAQIEQFANSKETDLEIRIDSLGGSYSHGIRLYEEIRKLKNVTIIIEEAASAATIVAMSAANRKILSTGRFLIHKARANGILSPNANDANNIADELNKLDNTMIDIYVNAVKKKSSREKIVELMNENNGNGIWLNAEEAMAYGFVDSIIDGEKEIINMKERMYTAFKIPSPIKNKMENKNVETTESLLAKIKNILSIKTDSAKETKAEVPAEASAKEIKADLQGDLDAANAKIAELEKENADLKAQVLDLEAQLNAGAEAFKKELEVINSKLDGYTRMIKSNSKPPVSNTVFAEVSGSVAEKVATKMDVIGEKANEAIERNKKYLELFSKK